MMMMIYWLICTLIMITLDDMGYLNLQISWVCGAVMGMMSVIIRQYLENRMKKYFEHNIDKPTWYFYIRYNSTAKQIEQKKNDSRQEPHEGSKYNRRKYHGGHAPEMSEYEHILVEKQELEELDYEWCYNK